MQDIKGVVRQYLLDNFVMGAGAKIADDVSFTKTHILDSTGFIELITFIEDTYHLKVEDNEMLPENFDSLINIEAYVGRKKSAAGAS
jgi:acyl carrier protein